MSRTLARTARVVLPLLLIVTPPVDAQQTPTPQQQREHQVKQGDWHPTADYPVYMTQSSASVKERGSATTLCVSPGDRNHDIIDVKMMDCRSVADLLQ